MKKINLESVIGFYGKPIECVAYDEYGDIIEGDSKRGLRDLTGQLVKEPVTKQATIIDLIFILIRSFPREKMTIDNTSMAIKVRDKLKNATDYLLLEDAECDWVVKQLKNNEIGSKVFGFDLPFILEAMEGNKDVSG